MYNENKIEELKNLYSWLQEQGVDKEKALRIALLAIFGGHVQIEERLFAIH